MKGFLTVVLMSVALVGCNGAESEKLKAENAALKSQVEKLESENNKLRETAQYHFRLAQDHIAAKNWSEAIASLQTVITKYPNDALVGPARESLSRAVQARDMERARLAEQERLESEARAREVAESGEPVSYGAFYAKAKMGNDVGKRYRFDACLNQIPCIYPMGNGNKQDICLVKPMFDDTGELEQWLSSGEKHCGTIVAAVGSRDEAIVYRLH
ncbi:hypothetical protein OFAG_00793 [Oxalobacter formigenes HOxBLS]|uniref:Tetratricopeptide repeat protein n=2 Tax=Oxalobacter paraformigenes TaxID=556268 RepID=C3X354_9BURK|nr:hypothetical protein OFAG_00793 [Oxalobacter paraformigenes]